MNNASDERRKTQTQEPLFQTEPVHVLMPRDSYRNEIAGS